MSLPNNNSGPIIVKSTRLLNFLSVEVAPIGTTQILTLSVKSRKRRLVLFSPKIWETVFVFFETRFSLNVNHEADFPETISVEVVSIVAL